MTEFEALYEPDGDAFVATGATPAGWSDQEQAGGPVLCLMGHVLDDIPTLAPMSVSRLTADLVRPAPIGIPMRVHSTILREGKKIQVVDLVVTSHDTEHARARVLRIRDEDLTGTDGLPRTSAVVDPAAALPPPDTLVSVDQQYDEVRGFLKHGLELRRTGPEAGVNVLWARFRVPVVAGEAIRPTSRVTMPMDLVNLIGVEHFDRMRVTAINPDVSAHVARPPQGEWVGIAGNSWFAPSVGHGISTGLLVDELGVFGTTSTSQIVQVP